MAEKDKKYYWLKLKRDFFKRHDIQIIENMPNGKDYILFYLKLLCESVDHDGNLRFNESIPYNEQMLSTITNTNVDIVRSAIKLFCELKMMEVLDDGTYFMREVQKMLGSETYWAQKKREQREKEQALLGVGHFPTLSNESPMCPSKSIDIEKDKDIDKDLDKKKKSKYGEYKHVLLTDSEKEKLVSEYGQDLTEQSITFLDEYIEMKGYKAKNHYLAIRKWVIDAVNERNAKSNPTPQYKRNQRVAQLPSYMTEEKKESPEERAKSLIELYKGQLEFEQFELAAKSQDEYFLLTGRLIQMDINKEEEERKRLLAELDGRLEGL